MKKYIVCWTIEDLDDYGYIDNYTVFVDDDTDINYLKASRLYVNLIKEKEMCSVKLCEIIKSTDN